MLQPGNMLFRSIRGFSGSSGGTLGTFRLWLAFTIGLYHPRLLRLSWPGAIPGWVLLVMVLGLGTGVQGAVISGRVEPYRGSDGGWLKTSATIGSCGGSGAATRHEHLLRPAGVASDASKVAPLTPGKPLTIGRATSNHLCLSSATGVSEHHAVVRFSAGGWLVCDWQSSDGTFLQGQLGAAMPRAQGWR